MASLVGVCNRALQKLGEKRITSLSDNSATARALGDCYEAVRDALLREHPWNFAISRAELAADAEEPDWGRANAYQLPSDFLRLLPDYPEDAANSKDWQIEGQKILTDDTDPIYIRYIARVTDVTLMDALFLEAWATKMAYELCELITQSNTKKEALRTDYLDIIRMAKKTNAIENVAGKPPEDVWITGRT